MGHLDIWYLPFEKLSLEENALSILSEEERIKAEDFVNEDDRDKYLLSHIYLRRILTFHSPHIDENVWQFESNTYGKPGIIEHQKNALYFNLTHSNSAAYIICSSEALCGIDVEDKKEMQITKGICDLVFSKEELLLYEHSQDKERMFYQIWTMKEAHLKALGSGLMETAPNTLNFADQIDLSKSHNYFSRGRDQYWSESFEDERFLAFCILNSKKVLIPKYMTVDLLENRTRHI